LTDKWLFSATMVGYDGVLLVRRLRCCPAATASSTPKSGAGKANLEIVGRAMSARLLLCSHGAGD
jgi:hypothetical protein